jgi:hypothetical protein
MFFWMVLRKKTYSNLRNGENENTHYNFKNQLPDFNPELCICQIS